MLFIARSSCCLLEYLGGHPIFLILLFSFYCFIAIEIRSSLHTEYKVEWRYSCYELNTNSNHKSYMLTCKGYSSYKLHCAIQPFCLQKMYTIFYVVSIVDMSYIM